MNNASNVIRAQFGSALRNYRVRMQCGHVELRKMREETAGIPWSPEAEIRANAPCQACCEAAREALRTEALAPRPEPKAFPRTRATIRVDEIREKDRTCRGVHYPGRVLDGHHAEITPGKAIRLFGERDAFVSETRSGLYSHSEKVPYEVVFHVGDECEESSYNLVYFGKIVNITRNSVAVTDQFGKAKRMDLATFVHRNYDFDASKARARNAVELEHI